MANQSVTGLSNLQISFTHDDGQETEKNLKDTSCLEGGGGGGGRGHYIKVRLGSRR